MKIKLFILVMVVLFILLVASVVIYFVKANVKTSRSFDTLVEGEFIVGNELPIITTLDFTNSAAILSKQVSKPLVIIIWTSWCESCSEELHLLEKLQEAYEDKITFLGIHRTDTESLDTGKKSIEEWGITFRILQDSNGSIYKSTKIDHEIMPTILFVGSDGVVDNIKSGVVSEDEIRIIIENYLLHEDST